MGYDALRRAVDDDKTAVPCVSCGRPTIMPGGRCVRCWPAPGRTYVHDCQRCQFLGQWPVVGMTAPVDWYQCGDSVIGRYDDAGHAYWSTLRSLLPRMGRDPFAAAARALYAARCDGACGSKGRAGEGCADPGHVS